MSFSWESRCGGMSARGGVSHWITNITIAQRQTIDMKNIARSCCPVVNAIFLMIMLPRRKPPAAPGTATTPTHINDSRCQEISWPPFFVSRVILFRNILTAGHCVSKCYDSPKWNDPLRYCVVHAYSAKIVYIVYNQCSDDHTTRKAHVSTEFFNLLTSCTV